MLIEESTFHWLRARWVFPVDEPPIEDGVIEITDGRVARLNSRPDAAAVDLGDVAVIPGLVNAHTHLEFSHLAQPLTPATPFADWIRAVVAARRHHEPEIATAIRQGIDESQLAGTACLGEIATSACSLRFLENAPLCSVVFREVLGLDEAAIERQQAIVETHLADHRTPMDSLCVHGLSPHAPYSVHPDLFRWTIDKAAEAAVPVAMHLAETPEELELLDRGTGPLVAMLRDFGVWQEGVIPRGTTILSYLEQLSRLERVLVVHGNYLRAEEIEFIAARPQYSVVYCPRTHRFFGHAEHPWRQLLERGVNVALGTDSRASNPDLSLWNEVVYLGQQVDNVPGQTLLRMATVNGARALGMDEVAGTITVGRRADLAVVAFGDDDTHADVYDRLLHPDSHIVGTMLGGAWQDA